MPCSSTKRSVASSLTSCAVEAGLGVVVDRRRASSVVGKLAKRSRPSSRRCSVASTSVASSRSRKRVCESFSCSAASRAGGELLGRGAEAQVGEMRAQLLVDALLSHRRGRQRGVARRASAAPARPAPRVERRCERRAPPRSAAGSACAAQGGLVVNAASTACSSADAVQLGARTIWPAPAGSRRWVATSDAGGRDDPERRLAEPERARSPSARPGSAGRCSGCPRTRPARSPRRPARPAARPDRRPAAAAAAAPPPPLARP